MVRWLAVFVLVLASTGVPAAPAAPLAPTERRSLDEFAAANAQCREWSDGCVVCVRQREGPAFSCSTPGIACTPSSLACRPAAAMPPKPSPKP